MKRFAFAITLVLMCMGSAFAQARSITEITPLWPGFSLSTDKMNGVEVSAGTLDYVDSICWGRTFSMMAGSNTFTIAPNYTFELPTTGETLEYVSNIKGGAWTLVYKQDKHNGMLFGEMTGGTIEWYMDRTGKLISGEITAGLNIKGGTGSFEKVGGPSTFGKFTGKVDYDKEGVPFITGTVDLMF
jgi:hypothetical protein